MPLSSDEKVVSTSKELVATLKKAFGSHAGLRPNHTKGILFQGTFTPTSAAAQLSSAPHFSQHSTPTIIRFSNSTGIPTLPDNDPSADPRGIAVRFDLGPHKHTDIIAHSTPFFPVHTGDKFLEFLGAVIASPPGSPSPSPIEQFLQSHPKAAEFVTAKKAVPRSFVETGYWGISALKLVNTEGKETFVRFRFVPEDAGEGAFDASEQGPDYLQDEIKQRVKAGASVLKLLAQIAEDGDVTDDATSYWPEERKLVELGSLSVESLIEDQEEVARKTIFDPIPRVQGMEPSADPLLEMRANVYLVSGRERR